MTFAQRHGGKDSIAKVVATMPPKWRAIMLQIPPYADFTFPKMPGRGTEIGRLVKRGVIENRGYHFKGQWQYRCTWYGEKIVLALAKEEGRA